MAELTAGQKRAEARHANREMRDTLEQMTNQQLKNFFGGFDIDFIDRIEKVIERVRDERAEAEIKEIEAKIEALKAQQKELAKRNK